MRIASRSRGHSHTPLPETFRTGVEGKIVQNRCDCCDSVTRKNKYHTYQLLTAFSKRSHLRSHLQRRDSAVTARQEGIPWDILPEVHCMQRLNPDFEVTTEMTTPGRPRAVNVHPRCSPDVHPARLQGSSC